MNRETKAQIRLDAAAYEARMKEHEPEKYAELMEKRADLAKTNMYLWVYVAAAIAVCALFGHI